MVPIRPPRYAASHRDYIKDCEEALAEVVTAIEREAEALGWSDAAIGCALMNLGRNRILAAQADPKTVAAIRESQKR